MPNKKINALDVRTAVATDLMLVGDPTSGTAYKSTLATLPLVPYTGATGAVNLGAFGLTAQSLNVSGLAGTGNRIVLSNSTGALSTTVSGDSTQYVAGDGTLITFPINAQSGALVREVRNISGATITKGTVIYINGASGNKPTIAKAIATGDSTSAQTFGIVQADISNNANGFVIAFGDLSGLNTSAFTEGAQLYLSGTVAGEYTATKLYAPTHLVYIGVVTRSHPTQGQIEVRIQNGYEIDELHNVSAQSPANNDGLFYNSTTSLWSKNTIAGVLGYTPVPTSRTLTINGTTLDLSADRSWTVAGGSMAIGGAITSATAGSVLFAGASGVLQQDNANLFWDDTNNRLGIGTSTPLSTLHVAGTSRFVGSTFTSQISAAGRFLIGNPTESTFLHDVNGTARVSGDMVVNGLTVGKGNGSLSENSAFGFTALANDTGNFHTAFGYLALNANTTGLANTGIGRRSMEKNTMGNYNSAIGSNSLQNNTTGSNNMAMGSAALLSNTTGGNNVAIGRTALNTNNGPSNVAIGFEAMYTNSGGGYNTAIGQGSLRLNNTDNNVGVGYQTLRLATAANNTAAGTYGLYELLTGSNNTAIGFTSLRNITTGSYNIGIGVLAGQYAGSGTTANQTSSNSLYIGFQTRASSNGNTNEMVIGYDTIGAGSNSVTLGNTSITKTVLRGTINAANLPTSPAGLSTGDIWNNLGILSIV